MSPWEDLLARAERERELAAAGRWEELAAAGAERAAVALALPAPTREALPLLERLAAIQDELTAALAAGRVQVAAELSALRRGQGAVRGYAGAPARGGWVDETH